MRPAALSMLALLAAAAGTPAARAGENWPTFRGPTGQGLAGGPDLPVEWSETHHVTWKTAIHDLGWSSPVIWGDQVWLTTATADGRDMYALCIDRDSGEVLLDQHLFHNESPRPLGNDVNSYASPTPAIEQGRVYVHFGSYGTAALDTETFEVLWRRRDLECNHWRGPASSVVLYGELVILTFDGADVQYTAALDKRTGRTVWLTPRSTDFQDLGPDGRPIAEGDLRKAFNTPLIVEHAGRTQMISPGAKAVFAYDPRDGSEVWSLHHHAGHSSSSRTLFGHGLAFINTGFHPPQLWAVRPSGTGELGQSHVAWTYSRNVPAKPSPVLAGELIFMVSDSGIATCLEATSGAEVWKQRLGGSYSASALYTGGDGGDGGAGGRVYFFSEEGRTTVLHAGRTFELIAENHLDDGFMASPAVAGSALFLRTRSHLYRIEE